MTVLPAPLNLHSKLIAQTKTKVKIIILIDLMAVSCQIFMLDHILMLFILRAVIAFVRGNCSWIGPPVETHETSSFEQTRRATTLSRPPLESSPQGDSKSA